jgi:hypothetical protein
MGSKIRNVVGSNFDEALRLLQIEIEKRVKENERPMVETAQKRKGGKYGHHKYAMMAFSRDSCHDFSSDKKLKLCADYASSTDFLHSQQEKKDVLTSYKHALLYTRHNKTFTLDHEAFICEFIEQLQDDASDVMTLKEVKRSIREFLSCLVLSDITDGIDASKVGELMGRYVVAHFSLESISSEIDGRDQSNDVINFITMTLSLLSFSDDSITWFLVGYIKYALYRISEESKSKTLQRAFVSTAATLSRTLMQYNNAVLQNFHIHTIENNVEKKANTNHFKDAKTQMKKILNWATEHVSGHSADKNSSQSKADDDH